MYNIYCNIPATYIIIYAYSFRKYFSIQDDRIMNNILLGNIISFVGSVVMIYVGVLKSKKAILITQGIQCGIMAVSNIVLGGLSGCLTNLITVIRNVYCLKFNYNRPVKIVLIAVGSVFGVLFVAYAIFLTAFDAWSEFGESFWFENSVFTTRFSVEIIFESRT